MLATEQSPARHDLLGDVSRELPRSRKQDHLGVRHRMSASKKFTPTLIAQIGHWVEQGVSARDIAGIIGCTLGTLRVKCSRLGISLKRRKSTAISLAHSNGESGGQGSPVSEPSVPVVVLLSRMTFDQLQDQAQGKAMTSPGLAATLLETIAQDGRVDAVLDESTPARDFRICAPGILPADATAEATVVTTSAAPRAGHLGDGRCGSRRLIDNAATDRGS
jgi:hypothetical protein